MDSMKKKIAYLLLLLMLIPVGSFAKEKRTFEIKDGHFYVNGKVTPILSGEMHYPRIPHQYWRHRLRMMRAMGLNTVATYVFWNLHETEPGKWDFEGDKNLDECRKLGVNDSMIHEDFMIGSADLSIDAVCEDGKTVAIFRNGTWAF